MTSRHPPEDIWKYPRPPRLELVHWPIRIEHRGVLIAETDLAQRVLETSHPPVYYLQPDSVRTEYLTPSTRPPTFCEWKGQATYLDLAIGDAIVEAACWRYPQPLRGFEPIADWLAFYPSRVDLCTLDDERVTPQPGDFYGGWITSWIDAGPRGFKGGPGTWGW